MRWKVRPLTRRTRAARDLGGFISDAKKAGTKVLDDAKETGKEYLEDQYQKGKDALEEELGIDKGEGASTKPGTNSGAYSPERDPMAPDYFLESFANYGKSFKLYKSFARDYEAAVALAFEGKKTAALSLFKQWEPYFSAAAYQKARGKQQPFPAKNIWKYRWVEVQRNASQPGRLANAYGYTGWPGAYMQPNGEFRRRFRLAAHPKHHSAPALISETSPAAVIIPPAPEPGEPEVKPLVLDKNLHLGPTGGIDPTKIKQIPIVEVVASGAAAVEDDDGNEVTANDTGIIVVISVAGLAVGTAAALALYKIWKG